MLTPIVPIGYDQLHAEEQADEARSVLRDSRNPNIRVGARGGRESQTRLKHPTQQSAARRPRRRIKDRGSVQDALERDGRNRRPVRASKGVMSRRRRCAGEASVKMGVLGVCAPTADRKGGSAECGAVVANNSSQCRVGDRKSKRL